MRNSWIAFLSLLIISCGKNPYYTENILLGGEIRNDNEGFITVQKAPSPYEVASGKEYPIDTIQIDSNWFFLKEFEGETGTYNIQYGEFNFPVYLEPAKKLNINFDAEDVYETLEFSSDTKKPTRYLVKIHQGKNNTDANVLFALSEDEFLTKVDSMRKSFDTTLVEFITDKPSFDKQFLKEQSLSHLYGTYVQMLNYAKLRHYYNDTLADLSEGFFNFKKEINLNDSNAIKVANYLTTIQLMMEDDLEDFANQQTTTFETYTHAKYNWIDSNIRIQKLRDFFLASTLKNYIKYDFHAEPDSIIQLGLAQISDSTLASTITTELDIRSHLAGGNIAPDFTAIDTAGASHQLSDLRGKVVYIDFWASWCGPCKSEAPHLNKLRNAFKNDDVVILSVSIDDYRGDWFKYIDDNNTPGEQWYVNGWGSKAAQQYVIQSIPRFVLIDATGKIVTANAPRPSTQASKEAISKLLESNS